jgi:hypothetical protein
MCGIAGFYVRDRRKRPRFAAGELANALLLSIESRGKDATGILAYGGNGGSLQMDKLAVKASDFVRRRQLFASRPRAVLCHTRAATQGDATWPENNHPVVYGTTLGIHNGIVWNDHALFNALGVPRHAEVDTEALVAAVNVRGWDAAVTGEAFLDVEGDYACAFIDPVQAPDELLLVRGNGSPLCYVQRGSYVVWASTPQALAWAWSKAIGTPPKPEKVRIVPEGTVLRFKGTKVERSTFVPSAAWTQATVTKWDDAFVRFNCAECGYTCSGSYSVAVPGVTNGVTLRVCGWCLDEFDRRSKLPQLDATVRYIQQQRESGLPVAIDRLGAPNDAQTCEVPAKGAVRGGEFVHDEDERDEDETPFVPDELPVSNDPGEILCAMVAEYGGYSVETVRDVLSIADELREDAFNEAAYGVHQP